MNSSRDNSIILGKQYLKNYCYLTLRKDSEFNFEPNSIFKGRLGYTSRVPVNNRNKKIKVDSSNIKISEGSYFEIIRKRSSSFKALSSKLGRLSSSKYHLLVIFELEGEQGWASFGFGPLGPESPDRYLESECLKLYQQENNDLMDINIKNEDLLNFRKKYKTNQPSTKLRQTKKYRKWENNNPNANPTNFYSNGDDTISVIANGRLNKGQLDRLLFILNNEIEFKMLIESLYLKSEKKKQIENRDKIIQHNCTSSLLYIFSDVITTRKGLTWISPAYIKKKNTHKNIKFKTKEIFGNNSPYLRKEVYNNKKISKFSSLEKVIGKLDLIIGKFLKKSNNILIDAINIKLPEFKDNKKKKELKKAIFSLMDFIIKQSERFFNFQDKIENLKLSLLYFNPNSKKVEYKNIRSFIELLKNINENKYIKKFIENFENDEHKILEKIKISTIQKYFKLIEKIVDKLELIYKNIYEYEYNGPNNVSQPNWFNDGLGGSQFIHIPNYGKRKVRYQKNGRPYVIVNKKKVKL